LTSPDGTARGIVAARFPDSGPTAVTDQSGYCRPKMKLRDHARIWSTPVAAADLLFVFGTRWMSTNASPAERETLARRLFSLGHRQRRGDAGGKTFGMRCYPRRR